MSVHKHNGRDMGPNPPVKKEAKLGGKEAAGKSAGGTDNMKADGRKLRSDAKQVPENGSAKMCPAGVHKCYGTSVPASVADKPAAKTKSPQNAT